MSSRKLLSTIPEERILNPIPKRFEWNGKEYGIGPLPDAALMYIASALGQASGLFDDIAQRLFADRDADKEMSASDLLPLLPAVPQILTLLIPCQSKLIAASLKIDETIVENEMPLRKKLEALKLIIEAEEMPTLIEHFVALVGAFRRPDREIAGG